MSAASPRPAAAYVVAAQSNAPLMQNEHGVPQYPKSDARRLFVLLAAIERLPRPTLTTLAAYTGHNKGTIHRDIVKLAEQYGVKIVKTGPVYRLSDWGPILSPSGIREHLPPNG